MQLKSFATLIRTAIPTLRFRSVSRLTWCYMSMFPAETIYLLAEVAIATVALSGITMVLATSRSKVKPEQASLISIQLRMATIVTSFCILPLIAREWGIDERTLWQLVSGLYLVTISSTFVWNYLHPIDASVFMSRLTVFIGLIAILLLGSNLWVGEAWLYLSQLFVGWLGSMVLFLGFIRDVLNEKS